MSQKSLHTALGKIVPYSPKERIIIATQMEFVAANRNIVSGDFLANYKICCQNLAQWLHSAAWCLLSEHLLYHYFHLE